MSEPQTALAPTGGQQIETKPKPGDQATGMDFTTGENFALLQRVATMLSQSTLVPKEYQGNLPNCIIALNMAQRIGADPLMVMQNLYIVHGRPGWSAQFVIATFNHCGRFSALRYEWQGERGKADWGCRAWAIEHATSERLNGAWITWEMVRAEAWDAKNGSKWKTMPEQMFLYRAGAWFVRAYAPEIAMGLQTVEELADIRVYETAPGSASFETKLEEPANGSTRAEVLAERLKSERGKPAPLPDGRQAADEPEQPVNDQPPGSGPEDRLARTEPTGERSRLEDAFLGLKEAHGEKVAKETLEVATGFRSTAKVPDNLYQKAIAALVDRAQRSI